MRCHVCKNEFDQVVANATAVNEGRKPLNTNLHADVKVIEAGDTKLAFCEEHESRMSDFTRAIDLVEKLEAGEVLPAPGVSKAKTIRMVMQLGVPA